jgi:hypothetical protein
MNRRLLAAFSAGILLVSGAKAAHKKGEKPSRVAMTTCKAH